MADVPEEQMPPKSQLDMDYEAAVEANRADPSDENQAKMQDLANQIVAKRQEDRAARETAAVAMQDGDGAAQPEPTEGGSEVGG
jgi:hypothetical protein